MFCVHATPEKLENTQQSMVIFDWCSRKTRTRKSHDHRYVSLLIQPPLICSRYYVRNEVAVFAGYGGVTVLEKLPVDISPITCMTREEVWIYQNLYGKIRLLALLASFHKPFLLKIHSNNIHSSFETTTIWRQQGNLKQEKTWKSSKAISCGDVFQGESWDYGRN